MSHTHLKSQNKK